MNDSSQRTASDEIPLIGLALVAVLVLLWGSNFPAMKIALSEIPPFTFRSVSNAIGAFGLLAIGRIAMGYSLSVPRRDLGPLIVTASLNIAGWQLLLTFGLLRIDASQAIIIAYTMPLWAALFARVLLKEYLSVIRIFGIVLGIGGILVLNLRNLDMPSASPIGAMLVLGAALCWASGTVAMKMHRWRMPTIMMTGWQVAIGTLPMLAGMAILEDPSTLLSASPQALAGMLYTAVIAMVICHWTWYSLLRMVLAAAAATSTLAIPVCGVYASALILGDRVGVHEVGALALVVTGLFSSWYGRSSRRDFFANELSYRPVPSSSKVASLTISGSISKAETTAVCSSSKVDRIVCRCSPDASIYCTPACAAAARARVCRSAVIRRKSSTAASQLSTSHSRSSSNSASHRARFMIGV